MCYHQCFKYIIQFNKIAYREVKEGVWINLYNKVFGKNEITSYIRRTSKFMTCNDLRGKKLV